MACISLPHLTAKRNEDLHKLVQSLGYTSTTYYTLHTNDLAGEASTPSLGPPHYSQGPLEVWKQIQCLEHPTQLWSQTIGRHSRPTWTYAVLGTPQIERHLEHIKNDLPSIVQQCGYH